LERAILRKANLKGTFLVGATLKGANLEGANLEGATIGDPIFKVTTILTDAALKNAILTNANLGDVKDLSRDQIYQAKLCRTNLPENIDLDPNRDCEELGINPETGEKNTYGSILGDLF